MRSNCGFLRVTLYVLTTIVVLVQTDLLAGNQRSGTGSYEDLMALFHNFREVERPTFPNGVPDYTAGTMAMVHKELKALQALLAAIDPGGWPIEQQVDFELLRAEMNGLDFYIRVLQPWARDPAFYALIWTYQSDTPAHEGPTSHAAIDLWTYAYPLSDGDEKKLARQLRLIPPLFDQARINLTGNARDLWIAGIKNIRDQADDLDDLAKVTFNTGSEFKEILNNAKAATMDFAEWLEEQAPLKNGPSGVGKANYTWHLRNVLLVPLSWEEEVSLLKRELDRAYAMLSLERHHNRNLPPLKAISSPEEFERRTDLSIKGMMSFLTDQNILPVREYMEPELRKHVGSFQPEEKRNFFLKILHLEPAVLYSHLTHWFETAMMRDEPHPSPLRRNPLLYNIWMSRSEGLATGVEEMFMHAGLYDNNPRARELVWIMLAQRCARGLASLYAHTNDITLEEARAYQIEWTPAGWMREDLGLVGFEQQLYLRQPGYGTSYVSGKYLIERLIADRSRQLGDEFKLKVFFDELYGVGMIPVSLIRWQLTGMVDEILKMYGE